jgi:CBS domain-containing protein
MANSQTEIFRRRVADCLGTPPPTAPVSATVSEAVDCLRETRASVLVLTDADNRPVGLLTEADITRRVAYSVPPETPVSEVMTLPLVTIAAGEHLYRAIARMRRNTLRHLPVVAADGALAGMLHLDDALAFAADELVTRIDRLAGDGGEAAYRGVKRAQVELAGGLLADNVPATEILSLITYVNNDIYRRVARDVLTEMDGAPPVPFALIVMGSGGRGENFLCPDQDNGLIIGDYPDADHGCIDGWFTDFADRLTLRMDAVGFPLCTGYVMATNPLWRKTQAQWRHQLDIWIARRSMAAVLLADIFFDFIPVAGDDALAVPVRDHVTRTMADAPLFLNGMARSHENMRSALGLFGRIRTDNGEIDLKRRAIQPAVAAVRLLALKAGISVTGTLDRVAALGDAGMFDADDTDEIGTAFRDVCDILLRAQISAFDAGRDVNNRVTLASLTPSCKQALRSALRIIEKLAARARSEFTGTTL